MGRAKPTPDEHAVAFWSKVDKSGGPEACWPWLGATDKLGYGRAHRADGSSVLAHRHALELTTGQALPPGVCALHHCDNPPCCNPGPRHLFQGTKADNSADMARKGRGRTRPHYGDDHWTHIRPERVLRGERNGCAKLTAAQVVVIRQCLADGVTKAALAREYGVSFTAIWQIAKGLKWKNTEAVA